MIAAMLKDQALLNDIAAAMPGGGLCVWWLGQSGYVIKSPDGLLVLDPYLSDSLTHKYADTDKPHVRMTELCLDPGTLRSVDVITSSHNHTDHLDAETLIPLLAANPEAAFVIPEANREFVAHRLGCDADKPLGLNDGQSLKVAGMTIHAVPAAHDELDTDEQGRHRYLGYVVQTSGGTIYHSGDTLMFDGLVDRLKRFDIDLALLPINGKRPERRVASNLFGDEAARLAHDIDARLVLPCHYDMFTFNTEPPDLFVETCRQLGQAHRVLACGERLHLPHK